MRPRGLTPRRLARLAGADPRGVRHATPDPWVPEPALVLSDVVAGREPWTGMLLDPDRPQPVPVGSLVRSAGPAPARHWLVWPDARLRPAKRLAGTDPRSVAAYLDEPAMAHFARELDEAAVRMARADQGDSPFDAHVIECAVAGGYGGDAAAADAVTAWIAETLRQGIPKGKRRAGIPRAPGRRARSRHAQRRLVCHGSDGGDPRGRDHPPRPFGDRARPVARRGGPLHGGRGPRPRREQWAEARETDRKETFVKAMAAAFGTNPPPAWPKLADDARQRALRWAPPGFEPARASAAGSGHPDIAAAAELPARLNG